jgi:hypothetical protein
LFNELPRPSRSGSRGDGGDRRGIRLGGGLVPFGNRNAGRHPRHQQETHYVNPRGASASSIETFSGFGRVIAPLLGNNAPRPHLRPPSPFHHRPGYRRWGVDDIVLGMMGPVGLNQFWGGGHAHPDAALEIAHCPGLFQELDASRSTRPRLDGRFWPRSRTSRRGR